MSTVSPNVPNAGTVTFTTPYTIKPTTDAGMTIVSTIAATETLTLPAATGTGHTYCVHASVTKTGDFVIQVANATDVMQGSLAVTTDAAGVVIPTAATSDTITMNGSTTGGLAGSRVYLQDVASGKWAVWGALNSSGVEATPFSAAVS